MRFINVIWIFPRMEILFIYTLIKIFRKLFLLLMMYICIDISTFNLITYKKVHHFCSHSG